jgi:hypothetical protein
LLGIQTLDGRKNEPTMNLGWIDDDEDFDNPVFKGTGIVVLHEFGHLLGMIHEHSRIDASFEWDKDTVYKELGGPPNNWSKKDCDEQIFQAYTTSEFNGSAYDKYSMMHYFFPSKYFKKDPNLEKITKMSDIDKEWLSKKYPKEKTNNEDTADKTKINHSVAGEPKTMFDIIVNFFWGSAISKIITVVISLIIFYYIIKISIINSIKVPHANTLTVVSVPAVPAPTIPTLPTPTLPAPTIPTLPTPTLPTLPTPTLPALPTPTLPAPTIPTLPAPTIPTIPTLPALPALPAVSVPNIHPAAIVPVVQ